MCVVEKIKVLNTTWFYYETMKRKLIRRLIYECRCDERLKTRDEGSTRLVYTGLCGGLERLKIETRLVDESFAGVMGNFLTNLGIWFGFIDDHLYVPR